MRWTTEPLYARLFILFLLVSAGVAIGWSLKLSFRLIQLSKHGRVTLTAVLSGAVQADTLAKLAITGGIFCEDSGDKGTDVGTREADKLAVNHTLSVANVKFQYLWELSEAGVASIEQIVRLTLLLTLLVSTFGAYPTWSSAFENNNITGMAALFVAGDLLLARISLGLGVGSLIYVLSVLLRRVLSNRMAKWKFFYQQVQCELSRK